MVVGLYTVLVSRSYEEIRIRSNCLIIIWDARKFSRSKPTMPNPQPKQLYRAANAIAAIGNEINVSSSVNPQQPPRVPGLRFCSIFTIAPDSSAGFLLSVLICIKLLKSSNLSAKRDIIGYPIPGGIGLHAARMLHVSGGPIHAYADQKNVGPIGI